MDVAEMDHVFLISVACKMKIESNWAIMQYISSVGVNLILAYCSQFSHRQVH